MSWIEDSSRRSNKFVVLGAASLEGGRNVYVDETSEAMISSDCRVSAESSVLPRRNIT